MNKIILMGRLTRDPEIRYSQSAEPVAVTRYALAVRRQFAKQGEPDVDFIECVAFGKAGEFASKYFRKGQMVSVVGKLQMENWTDQQNVKRTTPKVVIEEQHFAESKASAQANGVANNDSASFQPYQQETSPINAPLPTKTNSTTGFTPQTPLEDDDDLPF
ncbi:MAG: single-stranded DNA-binding protein [Epulopiscium sp. Nele67-Bin005]|nr:MAG: single-stranded DNA-binding protein [Epulopiscium sp. Nele67-Bin005]